MAKTQRTEPLLEGGLTQVADRLIVNGKEQGFLTPDEIVQALPETVSEPDQLFRVFEVFTQMVSRSTMEARTSTTPRKSMTSQPTSRYRTPNP